MHLHSRDRQGKTDNIINGGIILQNNKPVAFFSKKLNKHQINYTVTEKELLSIIELLKSFRYMLLGQTIIIWTDHKNLTHSENTKHSSSRIL